MYLKQCFCRKRKESQRMVAHYNWRVKCVKFDWKEMKDNLYRRHRPTNFINSKEQRKTTGYCEYCRKRYSNIEEHVNGERHKLCVEGTNFECLDSLISCFPLGNCLPVNTTAAEISGLGDNHVLNSGGSNENVDFSPPVMEGVVPMEVSDGKGGSDDRLDDNLDGSVNGGHILDVANVGDASDDHVRFDVDFVGDTGDNVRFEEGESRKFSSPACEKSVVNLPRHMKLIHGWRMASSKAVVGQFNMQRKKK